MSEEQPPMTKEEYDKAIAQIEKVSQSVSKYEWTMERLQTKREKLLMQAVIGYWKSIALKDDFLYSIRLNYSTYEYDCGMLNENLTRELLNLDGIMSNGNEDIRTRRKDQVKRVLFLQEAVTKLQERAVALSVFYRSCVAQPRYQALLSQPSIQPEVELPTSPVPASDGEQEAEEPRPPIQKQPSLQRQKSVHLIPVMSPEEFDRLQKQKSMGGQGIPSEVNGAASASAARRKRNREKKQRKLQRQRERREEEEERQRMEEEKEREREEELERKQREAAEERKRRIEEEEKQKREMERKQREEEAAKRRMEEEEAAKRRMEEEKEEEEEQKRRMEEEAKRRMEEEAKRRMEEEAKRRMEEAKREKERREEEERKRLEKLAEEERKKREIEEEQRKQREKEEEERKKREQKRIEAMHRAEQKRKATEEARLQAEEARRKAEEAAKQAEEAAKQAEEARRKAEEAEAMEVESSESESSSMEEEGSNPEGSEEEVEEEEEIQGDYMPKYQWLRQGNKLNLILVNVDFDKSSLRCVTKPANPTPKLIIQGYRIVQETRPQGYYGVLYGMRPSYKYVPFTTVIQLPDIKVDLSQPPEVLYYDDESVMQVTYKIKQEVPKKAPVRPQRRWEDEDDEYYPRRSAYQRSPFNGYENPYRRSTPMSFSPFFGGNFW